MPKINKSIHQLAFEYAVKIFEGKPGYSLYKAKKIYGRYYYLVEDCYNSLQTVKDVSRATKSGLFIETIAAIKRLGKELMKFNQAETPRTQIESAEKILDASLNVIGSFIEEAGYGTLENLMNDPEYLRFKKALETMNELNKQLDNDLRTVKEVRESLTNNKGDLNE